MHSDKSRPSSKRWLDYAVWTIGLWASLLNLLNFNHYPLFRPEVAIALAGLTVVGVVMGTMQQVARPHLAFVVAGLFAAITIDLNTSIDLNWFLAIWAGLALVGFFALDALLKIALSASIAVLLFQLAASATGIGTPARGANAAGNPQAASDTRSDRPAIVHLVLDSYLGLDGMALGPDHYRDLRAEQVEFFTGQGFQLYPRAYSRHSKTADSLPRLFSYGETQPLVHTIGPHYAVPEELPYFADLDKRGYRTTAALPAYFDLCVNQKLSHCHSWQSSDLTAMLGTELSAVDRAKVFAFNLLQLTYGPTRVAATMQFGANDLFGTETRWPFNRHQLFHLVSLREFDRFIENLADLRRGDARFIHLLLPHSPYGLTANCRVKPEAAWLNEHGPAAATEREEAYIEQMRCLQSRISRMLDALDETRAGREAIVLIHGDHGSRIAPAHPSLDRIELSQRELLMIYSTFFAIRVPGEAPGEVPGTHALDELMADFRDRDFASAPRPKDTAARVLIADSHRSGSEWRPLPAFEL